MNLGPTTERCQGRPVGNTMAQECWNCVRRTDVPADVKSVPWMQPPVIKWWWGECDQKIEPSVDTGEAA